MRNIMICTAMLGVMLLAGCGTLFEGKQSTPEFGSSVHMAVAGQTANPEAGGDAPVVGLDGKYAAEAMKKYQKGPREKSDAKTESTFGVVEVQ
ncbi:hypothetical protein DND132_2954 [Pseudodesulfovibrio mercurii]|uniref:Lipoprotein n=1 Tax=Pseudodesulfovibrio mercurii TaxID=641491 RepID=F0JJQ8_9BACT|nr:hypothetical protein [Pseudodesulfovibrio mercurii]EGB16157.1 hypothetical protein DND132_2954 [Pseudodesulfovibrio mercurii]